MSFPVLRSMQEWTAAFGSTDRTVLTVGNFDGIHRGHQKILRLVVAHARADRQRSAVITFDPHPFRLLRPDQAPRMIQTLEQRLQGFESMGVDAALVLRFDHEFSLLSAEQFIQGILIDCLHVGTVMVGENFCFGHRGAGNVPLLQEYGRQHGFTVITIPALDVDGRIVSSTLIRNAISAGDVANAASLLGRPFALTGKIEHGAGRGRTVLFPTLNLAPEQELLPKLGVYATESLIAGKMYSSVTNVGTRPTFDGHGITVESHLFGFAEEISEGRMEVRFHARLRDEQKFAGPDQLRAQIARDIESAREYFSVKRH